MNVIDYAQDKINILMGGVVTVTQSRTVSGCRTHKYLERNNVVPV